MLATWEADIKKIAVPGQPHKKFAKCHLNGKNVGQVACTYHPSYGEKLKIGGLWSMSDWAKSKILAPK
jgi:hypothetical protein